MFTAHSPSSAIIQSTEYSAADLTIETVRPVIETWTDLSEPKRKNLLSSVATVARLVSTVAEPVTLNCASLRPFVFGHWHRTHRLSDSRIANIRADLRFILRRLELHARHIPWRETLTPEWQEVMATCTDEYRLMRLCWFSRFASETAVHPRDVNLETFARFETWLTSTVLNKNPRDTARKAIATWNLLTRDLPGWTGGKLVLPGIRQPYTRPLADYAPEFQADVAVFARHLACDDPDLLFSDDVLDYVECDHGPRRAARPATIRLRLFQILQAGAALLHSGRPIESILSLRDLVDPPENARAIITFFRERARERHGNAAQASRASAQPGAIAELLRQIAAFHAQLPPKDVARITAWAKKVARPRQTGMTAQNRQRLRALIQPRNRAMVLHLPGELLRQADEAFEKRPFLAAGLALRAAALEILLICPLRISNLLGLRLDQHLQRMNPDRPKRISHFIIPEHEGKNELPLEWPVPRETSDLLARFLTVYRPLITPPGNPYLFPGKDLRPRSVSGMARPIQLPIKSEVGIDVNPHLLRAFAGWNYLKSHPGHYETVRRVLNHKSIETTINFYCGLEAEFAAEHFDATVLRDRKATKSLAAGAFRRNRTRGHKNQ